MTQRHPLAGSSTPPYRGLTNVTDETARADGQTTHPNRLRRPGSRPRGNPCRRQPGPRTTGGCGRLHGSQSHGCRGQVVGFTGHRPPSSDARHPGSPCLRRLWAHHTGSDRTGTTLASSHSPLSEPAGFRLVRGGVNSHSGRRREPDVDRGPTPGSHRRRNNSGALTDVASGRLAVHDPTALLGLQFCAGLGNGILWAT